MQSLGYDLIVDDDGIIQEAGKIVEKTEDFEQKLGELSDISVSYTHLTLPTTTLV